ncbi:MAG: DUF6526 family protein [Edaphobacter sp.]
MSTPQNFKNHKRWDPPMHFFVLPILLLNLIFSIYVTIHHGADQLHLHLWWIVVSIALFVLAAKCRINDLKLQDRIISLEERLRLAAILPVPELPHMQELTTKQLIALRFASDEELPALVHKTLTQGLEPTAIKENVTHWRADNHRI